MAVPAPARKPCSPREAARFEGIVLTPQDLAALLKIHERTVVRYLESGKLPGKKIGTKWRTARSAIDHLLT